MYVASQLFRIFCKPFSCFSNINEIFSGEQDALWPYIDSEINHIRHFIKIQFATRGLNSLTYPVYLKINLLFRLFLLILKIRNPLSFVIINLLVVLFLTITN